MFWDTYVYTCLVGGKEEGAGSSQCSPVTGPAATGTNWSPKVWGVFAARLITEGAQNRLPRGVVVPPAGKAPMAA